MLTPAHLATIERDGYAVVEAALDPEWVARLALAFDPSPARATQHVEIGDETPQRDSWQRLREHALTRAVAHLLDPPGRVRDLHGRAPTPGFGAQGLHADWPPRQPDTPRQGFTVLWMIDAFTVDNGATRVVPGTHRLREGPPRPLAQPGAHHADERVILGPAGAALVLDGHLWHSGTTNCSRAPRRAAQMVLVRGPRT